MNMQLPLRPNLEQLRKQAKALLKDHQAADAEALGRIRESHTRWQSLADSEIAATRFAPGRRAAYNREGNTGSRAGRNSSLTLPRSIPCDKPGNEQGFVDAELVEAIRKAAGQRRHRAPGKLCLIEHLGASLMSQVDRE